MTFAALVALIQNEINDNTSQMQTRIEGWVNDAHHEICAYRDWVWLEAVVTSITLKTSNLPINIQTGFSTPLRKILDILDYTASPYDPLRESTSDEVRGFMQNYANFTDIPEYYYMIGVTLDLFPPADATGRSYSIRGTKLASSYTTGSTSALLVPDRWVSALKYSVLYRAWAWLNDPRAATSIAEFNRLLDKMLSEDTSEGAKIQYAHRRPPNSILPRLIDNS